MFDTSCTRLESTSDDWGQSDPVPHHYLPQMPRQPEGKLAQKILVALRAKGGWWTKIHGGEFQEVGLPDIVGCYKGRFVGIEVKMPGGKPTERQRYVLAQVTMAGGIAAVVSSVEGALEVLSEHFEGE